ncbi:MAG: GDP-mannose 4,6-dehydratase, partial [Kiritimatiellia bacterium]
MNFNNTFENKRVLVTGDTGFKGSWLCEWLLMEGAEVFGIALPPNTTPSLFVQLDLSSRIQHTDLDIRDEKALREKVLEIQPEFVFHLAAQPLVRLSYSTPVETFATNVMGTVHVLDALRHYSHQLTTINQQLTTPDQQPKHCVAVMITTDKCYQNKEWLHAYREEDPMGGHDPYSASKGACELVIQSY